MAVIPCRTPRSTVSHMSLYSWYARASIPLLYTLLYTLPGYVPVDIPPFHF
nr:MAG TPA: hypothetical protein [Caudoviricetes sp.]